MIVVPKGREIQAITDDMTTWKESDDGGEWVVDRRFYFLDGPNVILHSRLRDKVKHLIGVKYYDNKVKRSLKPPIIPGDKYKPRDYQTDCINFIRVKKEEPTLINLEPGKGKSYIGTMAMCETPYNISIVVKSMYMDKWKSDIMEYTTLPEEEIMLVQGRNDLKKVMLMDSKDMPKVIIYSGPTMRSAITEWMESRLKKVESFFPMPIEDLLKHTRGGFLLIDELHQEFHAMYRTLIMLNPPKFLGLSATFDSENSEIQKRYDDIVPRENILNPLDDDAYKDITSVEYNIGYSANIKWINYFTKGYSHVEFEKSIMKNRRLTMSYFKMLIDGVDKYYMCRGNDKGKMLIYFSTIAMIDLFVELMERLYPDIDTRRFVAGDPKANLIEPDIRCSTLGKAGTAVDIPNLRCVLQPVGLSSKDGNLQSLGRLRKIHGVKTEFVYYWTRDIKESERYHNNKFKLFDGKYSSWNMELYRRPMQPVFGGRK